MIGAKCYSDDINIAIIATESLTIAKPISIAIIATESLTINLTNCLLDHTALTIISQCYGNNKIYINNCTFENNYMYKTSDIDLNFKPLINIVSAHDQKSISFE